MTADGLLSKRRGLQRLLRLPVAVCDQAIPNSKRHETRWGDRSVERHVDAHAQLRIVDHDRASINRTSTNSANRHVAMIGTYGETIPVEGFMDRCFLMRLSRSWTRENDIGRRDYRGQDDVA